VLEDFRKYLQEQRGLAATSIKTYTAVLKLWIDFATLSGFKAAKATTEQVAGFIAQRDLAPQTRCSYLAALHHYFVWCKHHNLREDDPTADIHPPRTRRRLPRVLSLEEVEHLLKSIPPGVLGVRDRAIMETLYSAGLRSAELLSLKVKDMARNHLVIRGKGGRERLQFLGKAARFWLNKYLHSARPELALPTVDALFVSKLGKALRYGGLRNLVREAGLRAGIEGLSPHVLRHTYATHLFENGADLRSLQELMGHADISVTQIYTHVSEKHLRKVAEMHPRA